MQKAIMLFVLASIFVVVSSSSVFAYPIFAVGDHYQENPADNAVVKYNGTSWKMETVPFRSADSYITIAMRSDGKFGFVPVSDREFLRYQNGVWTRVQVPIGSTDGRPYCAIALSANADKGFAADDTLIIKYQNNIWLYFQTLSGSDGMSGCGGMALTPDGNFGFYTQGKSIYKYSGANWTKVYTHPRIVWANGIAISDDKKIGFATFSESNPPNMARWNGVTWTPYNARIAPGDSPRAVALSSDGKIGFLGTYNGRIYKWNGVTWLPTIIVSSNTKQIRSISISSDGTTAYAGGENGLILKWNKNTNTWTKMANPKQGTDTIFNAMSPRP